jgi:hypothetical protein
MTGLAPEQFSTNTDDIGFMVNTSGSNALISITDTNAGSRRFYRIGMTIP